MLAVLVRNGSGSVTSQEQGDGARKEGVSNMELAKKVYQINDNRADNLQPARIVCRPLSGDVLHPAVALRNDLCAVS